jgi:hypothetical protein
MLSLYTILVELTTLNNLAGSEFALPGSKALPFIPNPNVEKPPMSFSGVQQN